MSEREQKIAAWWSQAIALPFQRWDGYFLLTMAQIDEAAALMRRCAVALEPPTDAEIEAWSDNDVHCFPFEVRDDGLEYGMTREGFDRALDLMRRRAAAPADLVERAKAWMSIDDDSDDFAVDIIGDLAAATPVPPEREIPPLRDALDDARAALLSAGMPETRDGLVGASIRELADLNRERERKMREHLGAVEKALYAAGVELQNEKGEHRLADGVRELAKSRPADEQEPASAGLVDAVEKLLDRCGTSDADIDGLSDEEKRDILELRDALAAEKSRPDERDAEIAKLRQREQDALAAMREEGVEVGGAGTLAEGVREIIRQRDACCDDYQKEAQRAEAAEARSAEAVLRELRAHAEARRVERAKVADASTGSYSTGHARGESMAWSDTVAEIDRLLAEHAAPAAEQEPAEDAGDGDDVQYLRAFLADAANTRMEKPIIRDVLCALTRLALAAGGGR